MLLHKLTSIESKPYRTALQSAPWRVHVPVKVQSSGKWDTSLVHNWRPPRGFTSRVHWEGMSCRKPRLWWRLSFDLPNRTEAYVLYIHLTDYIEIASQNCDVVYWEGLQFALTFKHDLPWPLSTLEFKLDGEPSRSGPIISSPYNLEFNICVAFTRHILWGRVKLLKECKAFHPQLPRIRLQLSIKWRVYGNGICVFLPC